MATKKRSGEEINDRQILCGMGIKLRRLTAGICLITQLVFPMAAAAQGVVNAATQQPVPAQIAIANANTVPYTLGALESAQSVAERFGISVAELRKLNQFRTFARGFDNVRQGDELDVPAQVSENNLTPPPGNSSGNLEQQIASTSQQIGSLLAEDMNSEQAANMARGWASSQASGAMTDWLSRFGTARITLGVDEDFSLKNSQFDFLHPWYETPDNLFFSQHTLHRTDERTQINNGLGWRHFTPTWMSGINFFFDHDLSRYHSRAGIGAEYWRDYLKLSSNGYLRLTNWRSAPELDNDYEARPANGWDVRAEGWLPAWPHLGGKLVYEQYYGDEVALFDKDDRQSNPHAITAGLNYTPFPLMTFSAEQRQGKQGENDTRFAVDFTWQPGSAMQKQLDPNEVDARRSLAGSRFDLVDRNNNIVLEYRKKELVRLTLTDPVTGKSGEVKSLVSSLQTKYALKGYNVEATALEAAGGKVVTTGKDILVTLPAYRFTSTPETDNTWPIEVTAEDVKGNFSNREQSMVVVQAPTLSQKDSSVSLSSQTLSADSHSTATLTFIAHDAAGNPVIGLVLSTRHEGVQDITLSDWKDNGDGSYTQILTTGAMSGTLTLMPQLNGVDAAKAPAVVNIISVSSSRTHSSIKIDKDRYLSGNPIEVTVELRDENDKPVKEQKQQLNTAVSIDNVKPGVTTDWKETADGVYKATYTAYTKGSGLTAKLLMQNWNEDLHTAGFIIDANPQSAKIATLSASNNGVLANENAANTVSVNVADEGSNPINDHTVTFAVLSGSATSFNNQNTAKTDVNGLATFDLKSSKQEDNTVEVTLENGVKQTLIVSFVGDSSTAQVDLQKSKNEVVADGNDSATMTATVRDAKGNLLNDVKVTFNVNSAAAKLSQTEVNSHDGIATATLTSLKNGDYTVTASVSSGSQANQQVIFIGDQSTAALTLSVPSGDITVTNTAPLHMTATLQDKNGNPLKDKEITFSVPNDVASRFSISNSGKGMTDSNGTAIASLTGTLAGTHMITARLANSNVSDTQPMTFVADKTSALVVLQISKNEITGNGVDSATLTATVKDQFDNEVNNLPVTFSTASSGLTLTPGESNTNESGIAQATLAGVAFGEQTVTASLANNGASDNKTVHFIGDTAAAKIIELTPVPDSIIAGTPQNSSGSVITATVVDNNGFPVKGVTVNFTSNAATAEMTNGGQAVTNEQGKATVTYTNTRSSIESGARPDTVEASLENGSSTLSTSINVNADASTAHLTLLQALFDTVSAGDTTNLYIEVKDNYGNGVPQQEVTLSVSPSEGVTPSNNAIYTTNHDGNFYASFTATKAGVYQVTATLENGDSMQQTVTYVPNVANAEISLAASKDPVIANNNDLTTLTATVADTEGNAIANSEVTFTLPEDVRANFTLGDGGKVVTDTEGKAKVTLKGTKAGAHTVTASMAGGKSEQLVVNFIADTLTAQVNLNVTEDNFIANNVGMTRLQATVTDGNGNPLANEAVTFTLPADVSASFTLGQGGSAITDINGKAEVTLSGTKSGTYPVTVSVNNYGVSDTKQVTLIADAGTAKLASLTSVYSFVVSTTEGATMTASVTDANGNPVEGIKVNFRGTSVTLSSTSVETDDRGFAEILVTSTEVGLKTVSASLADKPTEVISRLLNAKADINSATITSLEIPEGQVMVAQDVAVKAHVNDQFGNPILNESVTFSAEPPEHMTISQNIVSTDTHGIAEVTMTPERNGSYMVKASLANGSSYEKDLVVIDQKLTLSASSPLIGVNSPTGATLTATLTSANGTPVEGQVINFSVTPEGATLSGGKVRTNSSGQAPVVLTSNKVGTYTVTASFHNGVTIQTQTIVKVTGNSSTAHVASFIADPSTIAATNSDLSTLKATVEDGSGNLIEGLTVYFALKSGSATLTSLTAVTDQNGIATTSVRGAITGSVTVSAVTTAGGMQTVDITLVAGPADASQSVLKNNRSSLKGDFTDSAELHLVLHDISGNPIKVSEGLEFVQSGTNAPYVQVSAIDYSKNFSGEYKATVTGGGEGIATLIPVLNGVHQAGLSTTIQFTRAEDKIMSGTVLVNGANLPTTTFPSQGFTGAYYQLNNDNFAPGKTAADYEFSSSASWVDVDATGKVTFKNVGSKWERITATPKTGGPSYIYEIRVKSWWVNAGDAFMIYSLAENFCSSNGYTLPLGDHLNHSRSRGIGSLYSEWGDMGHYTTEAGFHSNMYWSSSPANSNEQYVVSLATGDQSVFEKLGFAYATCYKNL
ncbi:inverse autotransporter adhesin-like protein YeeJ [Escherichia coli]|uniref:Ig-like domain-containing protein n=1 Tax=Escherichia coli TaxID=562 RepID=UPI000FB3A55D|nr:Ig-like domain-containing protein [Escherichia coli]ELW2455394.1 Ig-like domain-containing protein [Escherichia coli O157]EED1506746.1 inverse autotransporter adhesin-like protein YeeJ [Escherichia coli]EED1650918.1 inverse autotransporter adhesin-like protein YeeJ [Escherichia coli]EED1868210.1 inverse autotransporter adhesin-like protein YeeJ [Escherichia coli]EEQ1480067.1 inverse autotransporter adhesin-like protein YeeJ [Escherichia coli]